MFGSPYEITTPASFRPGSSTVTRPQLVNDDPRNPSQRRQIGRPDRQPPAVIGLPPLQINNFTATESPVKSQDRTVSLVSLSYTRDGHDKSYAGVRVWVKNYKGSTADVLVADGRDAPLSFLMESTGENVIIKLQPFSWDGLTLDLDKCVSATVLLDGVISAPPEPTIAQQLTSITYGLQFAFNYLTGQAADIVDGYYIYRSATNDSATSSRYKYVKHTPINTGTYTFQDNVGSAQTFYYWVTAINTQGLESGYTAAQDAATASSGASTTTTLRPSASSSSDYTPPAAAYDGNLSVAAVGNSFVTPLTTTWSGFSAAPAAPTAINLKIRSDVNTSDVGGFGKVEYSLNSGGAWTTLYTSVGNRALSTSTVALGLAQDCTLVQVRASQQDCIHDICEIWIEVTT